MTIRSLEAPARAASKPRSTLRIGIVDTGVNAWHSHVRGSVSGCRIHAAADGTIVEDGDFRDLVGHGTAIAGVIREALPAAEIFAVRVFGADARTYPSLVARGLLRAVAERCAFVNLSLSIPPGAGDSLLREACAAALRAGCVLVAPVAPGEPQWLPASIPGVHAVRVDDSLPFGSVREEAVFRLAAGGSPRDLAGLPREANLFGASFACARALAHLALRAVNDRPDARNAAAVS